MKADTCILNHLTPTAAHDGWIHACPFGEHEWISEDGSERILQVIDPEAAQAIINSYPPAEKTDSLIDWEHESMTANGRTEAAGWGERAEIRNDGVWVRSDWSDTGRAAVEGKRFKFCSPCFPRDGLVSLGGNRYRITKMGRIALTNNPNLRGQKPLINRRQDSPSANPEHKPQNTMDYKAIMLTLLGLPADATDEQLANATTAQLTEKADLANARARITELETQLVNTDLDAHGITDVNQRNLFTPLLANKGTRDEALKTLGALKSKAPTAPTTIHNRSGAPVPGTDQKLSDADDTVKAANVLHNRALRYRDTHKVSYERAMAVCAQDAEAE